MSSLPPGLEPYRIAVTKGESVSLSVRELLAFFSVARRSTNAIAQIDLALRAAGLRTEPDFADAWIDDTLLLRSVGQPEPPPPQTTAVAEAPPAVPPPTVLLPVGNAAHPPTTQNALRPRLRRIGAFDGAHRKPVSVTEGDSLEAGFTELLLSGREVLAVFKSPGRSLLGALTWKDITVALREFPSETPFRTVLERFRFLREVPVLSLDEDVFAAAAMVAEKSFVFVRNQRNEFFGPLTATEVVSLLGPRLEPFVLAGEIEQLLRALIAERLQNPQAASYTIGECQRELQNVAVWQRVAIALDRNAFDRALDDVRRIRNELVHFNVDDIPAADLERLRTFHQQLHLLTTSPLTTRKDS